MFSNCVRSVGILAVGLFFSTNAFAHHGLFGGHRGAPHPVSAVPAFAVPVAPAVTFAAPATPPFAFAASPAYNQVQFGFEAAPSFIVLEVQNQGQPSGAAGLPADAAPEELRRLLEEAARKLLEEQRQDEDDQAKPTGSCAKLATEIEKLNTSLKELKDVIGKLVQGGNPPEPLKVPTQRELQLSSTLKEVLAIEERYPLLTVRTDKQAAEQRHAALLDSLKLPATP